MYFPPYIYFLLPASFQDDLFFLILKQLILQMKKLVDCVPISFRLTSRIFFACFEMNAGRKKQEDI